MILLLYTQPLSSFSLLGIVGPLVFRRKDGADKVQEAVKPIDEGILVVKNIEKVKKIRGEGKLVYRPKN